MEVKDDLLDTRPAEGVFGRDILGDDILDRGVFTADILDIRRAKGVFEGDMLGDDMLDQKDDCLDTRPAEGVSEREDPRDGKLDRGVVRDGFSEGGDISERDACDFSGCGMSEFMLTQSQGLMK